ALRHVVCVLRSQAPSEREVLDLEPLRCDVPMKPGRASTSRVLAHFFVGAYVLLLALCLPYLSWAADLGLEAYAIALVLTQAAFYLAPAFVLTQLAHAVVCWRRARLESSLLRLGVVYCMALALTTATAIAVVSDSRVFAIFGFHLNGFVLNLLTTPCGIDSMGLGKEGVASFARVAGTLGVAHGALLFAARRLARVEAGTPRPRRVYRSTLVVLALVALSERVTYAIGEARANA